MRGAKSGVGWGIWRPRIPVPGKNQGGGRRGRELAYRHYAGRDGNELQTIEEVPGNSNGIANLFRGLRIEQTVQ